MNHILGPLTGARSRVISVVVGVAVGLVAVSDPGAVGAKGCRAGRVRQTVAYVKRAGGPVQHATGCVPRTLTPPTSVIASLGALHASALKLVPAPVARALHSRAARRVLSATRAADGTIAAAAAAPLAARRRGVHAATVTHGSADRGLTDSATGAPEPPPPGTKVRVHLEATQWDAGEPDTGYDRTATVTTTDVNGAPGAAASMAQTYKEKFLIGSCPDAAGVTNGTFAYSNNRRTTIPTAGGGRAVVNETHTLEGALAVHFADDAHVASFELIGKWTDATTTSRTAHGGAAPERSRHARGGPVTATGFHTSEIAPGVFGNNVELTGTTTTASDSNAVLGGRLAAMIVSFLPELDLARALEPLQAHVLGGGCVKLLPDADTVHVAPGASVLIGAHLTDSSGATFAGPITAITGAGQVTPATKTADPSATFVYTATDPAPGGGTDFVTLRHVSRRGKASDKVVHIVYDTRVPFPKRFDGTFTRTITGFFGQPGMTETINGTAAYVRDASPQSLEGQVPVSYYSVSGSATWTVSGSDSFGSGCTQTYSGSGGSPAAPNNANGRTEMSLEDVSTKPDAPQPEPQPYYYSISEQGDSFGSYTISYSGPPVCTDAAKTENLGIWEFDIGYQGNFSASTPQDKVRKSATTTKLAGHVAHDELGGIHLDDSWSFTGSGVGP